MTQMLTLILCLGFVWASVYNILPVSFPAFKKVFEATIEQLGRTQLLFFVGGLMFTAVGGQFIERLGLGRAAAITTVLVSMSLVVIGSAAGIQMVLLGAACFGLAMASLDVVCSSMIAEHFGKKRQSIFLLYAAVTSLGGIIGPAILGWWLTHGRATAQNWRTGYYLVSCVLFPLAFWALRVLSPQSSGKCSVTARNSSIATMRIILSTPTIYVLGLAYFLHGVAQTGMISWVGQLYQRKYEIDAAHAAYLISSDLIGFFVGRSLLSYITTRWKISELLLMAICAGLASLAFVGTIAAPTYGSGLISFMISGFFISADGPSINSYVGLRFAERAAHAFVLMNGIGVVGSAVGAYVTGLLGERFGLERGIWFMPGFSAALSILALVWVVREGRYEEGIAA
jgi:MFS family permease